MNKPHIRWMIRRDLPEVLEIEEDCFEFPWTEKDFVNQLGERNCIGMVAELEEKIVGYMLYYLKTSSLDLENFAVAREYHRMGFGTALIDKLKSKMSPQRRRVIKTRVRETNLLAQLFLRSQGFRAISILRKPYYDSDEDAYFMTHFPLVDVNEYFERRENTKGDRERLGNKAKAS